MREIGRRSKGTNRGLAAALISLVGLLGAVIPMGMGGADEGGETPFPLLGAINYRQADGTDLGFGVTFSMNAVEPGLRRLISVANRAIYMINVDTLLQEGVPGTSSATTGIIPFPAGFVAQGSMALDTARHRAFFGGTVFGATSVRAILAVSLTESLPQTTFTIPSPYSSQTVVAVGFDAGRSVLYAITSVDPLKGTPVVTQTVLHAFDARGDVPTYLWSYPISECAEVPEGITSFLGAASDYVYFACRGLSEFGSPAIKLHGVARVALRPGSTPQDTSNFSTEFFPFGGDMSRGFAAGDPTNHRLGVFLTSGGAQRTYVFDAERRAWVGSVPLGTANIWGAVADPVTGRLYVTQEEGLRVSDLALLPASQGQPYELDVVPQSGAQPAFDPQTRRLFIPGPNFSDPVTQVALNSNVRVYEDRTPLPEPVSQIDPDDETHQIVEVPGRTPITFSGSASAYGSREIFVGGQRAITGNPADPGTTQDLFAWVKKTEVSSSAATSAAIRSAQSQDTEQDTLSKQSSCKDFGGSDDKRADSNAGSEVLCDLEHRSASGSSTASNESSPTDSPFTVSSSWSSVKVFKDPDRGMVARASAAAKGITIAGVIRIGDVQVDAETWAHGRDGTADSSFNTTIKEFVSAGLSCGFGNDTCDPQAVAAEINRTFQGRIQAFVPPKDLDPNVKGSDGGAQSVVVKDPYWYWSEFNVNTDAQKEVPGLQIVSYYDQAEPSRHVIHLAAVFAESHYAIGLPPLDPPAEPALLKIILTDDSEPPEPLSGGTFEVYADKDGNGVIDPLTDSVIQGGRCTTGENGTGDCLFKELAAGDYVVHEAAAPGGYAPGPDTPVELLPGFAATATFINLPAIGFIDASLTDDSEPPKPLAGGSFEVYADNGDLALGAGDQRLAACRTNELGECMFNSASIKGEAVVVQCKRTQGSAKPDCTYDPDATEGNTLVVPLGSYIAREATAPGDYLPGEDRHETLASPYSQAHFRFVNGLKGIEGTPGTPAVSGSGGSTTPGTTVEEGTQSPQATVTQQPLEPSQNILLRIIRLPADIWRFLQRHPGEALLFGLLWILLGLPLWLGHRRRLGWLVARSATY